MDLLGLIVYLTIPSFHFPFVIASNILKPLRDVLRINPMSCNNLEFTTISPSIRVSSEIDIERNKKFSKSLQNFIKIPSKSPQKFLKTHNPQNVLK